MDSNRVATAYDSIAERWAQARGAASAAERRRLMQFISGLPASAGVLDLGCGCGQPMTRLVTEAGFTVVGLDVSPRMLELASRTVPAATFLLGDMRPADPGGPFDGIVAWDSVFHLPLAEHPALYSRLSSWLRPGGRLLISLGGSGPDSFTSEMYGETFFYSGQEPSETLAALGRAGFRITHWEVDDPSSRGHVAIQATREA